MTSTVEAGTQTGLHGSLKLSFPGRVAQVLRSSLVFLFNSVRGMYEVEVVAAGLATKG